MAQLDEISFGRIYTHISGSLESLERASVRSRSDVDALLLALGQDAVYKEISSGQFRAATSRFEDLNQQLARVRVLADTCQLPEIGTFLDRIGRFISSHEAEWAEEDYFTVPVMVSRAGSKKTPGFVYLRAVPKMNLAGRSRGMDLSRLTSDSALLSATRDYFGTIASALTRTFYFVRAYPFDWEEDLGQYSYRLAFNCQITEGRSMGAAVLASFAVAFLMNVLGDSASAAIAPQRGTVLTGVIEHDGSITMVDDIAEKVSAALEELGPSLRLILPTGSELPPSFTRQVDPDNITYVSSVTELLSAVLSPGSADDVRGLYEARRRVFAKLSEAAIRRLQQFRDPEVDPSVFRIIAQGGRDWTTPQSKEGGIYINSKCWKKSVTIRLGLERSAAEERPVTDEKELIELVVDGSARMDPFWEPTNGSRISRVADVVFEVASRIDPKLQQLAVVCLSSHTFREIEAGTPADELEDTLGTMRETLRSRGAFFRPVYEASVERYKVRQKRVFLLSDSMVPDWDDLSDYLVSSRTAFRFLSAGGDSEGNIPVLYPDGKSLNTALLKRHFDRNGGKIRRLELRLGNELPVHWEPREGALHRNDDQFVLCWEAVNDLKFTIQLRMAHQAPLAIEYSGEVDRPEGALAFRFVEPLVASRLALPPGHRHGSLLPGELTLWERMCAPSGEGDREVRLLERTATSIKPRPVFQSLGQLRGGWLALRAASPEWYFFNTGLQVDDHRIAFVILNGGLYSSTARGHIERVEPSGYVYRATAPTGLVWYLCRI